jgi:hypothetical protein
VLNLFVEELREAGRDAKGFPLAWEETVPDEVRPSGLAPLRACGLGCPV